MCREVSHTESLRRMKQFCVLTAVGVTGAYACVNTGRTVRGKSQFYCRPITKKLLRASTVPGMPGHSMLPCLYFLLLHHHPFRKLSTPASPTYSPRAGGLLPVSLNCYPKALRTPRLPHGTTSLTVPARCPARSGLSQLFLHPSSWHIV